MTFYGGGVTEGRFGFGALVDEAPALQAPWLGLYGDLDHAIPVAGVEELRVAAAKSGQPTEIVRYPDAGHGFNCDQRQSYHEPSATRRLAAHGRVVRSSPPVSSPARAGNRREFDRGSPDLHRRFRFVSYGRTRGRDIDRRRHP